MATLTGLGVSTKLDSFIAGREAASGAFSQILKHSPNIIIVFISTIFDQEEVIRGIRSVIHEGPLIGCSSSGIISNLGSFKDAVGIFLIYSDSLSISYGIGTNLTKGPRSCGKKAAIQASESANIKKQAYIILSNPFNLNCTDIIRGTQEVLGTSFPIIGGGASNEILFPTQKTYQYLNNTIYTDAVVGFIIGGHITTDISIKSSWQPVGKPHRITSARSNLLRQIDKKVAIELYEEYFEKPFEELKKDGIIKLGMSYPIGVWDVNKNDYIIRMPLMVEENGVILLNGELSEGLDISLMIGDKNRILESTSDVLEDAIKDIKIDRIKFVLIFSDIARLKLLKRDANEEIKTIQDILGRDIPFFGCYTYGEYASSNKNDKVSDINFNSHSIVIGVFSE